MENPIFFTTEGKDSPQRSLRHKRSPARRLTGSGLIASLSTRPGNAVVRNQGARDQTLCKGHSKPYKNQSACCGIGEKHAAAFHDSEEGCHP